MRRRSSSVSATSGGSGTGFPCSSVATKTRYADATWTTLPVSMSSASTRTPISMLVFPTWFTDAFAVTRCPTYTGARKESSSIRAVTTRARACLVAAAPATSSMSFMTSPPWTLPYGLASDGSIVRNITVFDAATVLAPAGTARFCHPRLASPRDRPLPRRAPRGADGDAAAHRGCRPSPAAAAERRRSARGASAAAHIAGTPRRRGQRSRAGGARGRAGRQGRLVGSAPRRVRHHLPREGEPAGGPHGPFTPAVELAPLGCRDPRRGLGR